MEFLPANFEGRPSKLLCTSRSHHCGRARRHLPLKAHAPYSIGCNLDRGAKCRRKSFPPELPAVARAHKEASFLLHTQLMIALTHVKCLSRALSEDARFWRSSGENRQARKSDIQDMGGIHKAVLYLPISAVAFAMADTACVVVFPAENVGLMPKPRGTLPHPWPR